VEAGISRKVLLSNLDLQDIIDLKTLETAILTESKVRPVARPVIAKPAVAKPVVVNPAVAKPTPSKTATPVVNPPDPLK